MNISRCFYTVSKPAGQHDDRLLLWLRRTRGYIKSRQPLSKPYAPSRGLTSCISVYLPSCRSLHVMTLPANVLRNMTGNWSLLCLISSRELSRVPPTSPTYPPPTKFGHCYCVTCPGSNASFAPPSSASRLYFLAGAGGVLTLLDNQARPSMRPSPVVAQLGTTYHTLSLSLESWSASVTSCGFIAVNLLVSCLQRCLGER